MRISMQTNWDEQSFPVLALCKLLAVSDVSTFTSSAIVCIISCTLQTRMFIVKLPQRQQCPWLSYQFTKSNHLQARKWIVKDIKFYTGPIGLVHHQPSRALEGSVEAWDLYSPVHASCTMACSTGREGYAELLISPNCAGEWQGTGTKQSFISTPLHAVQLCWEMYTMADIRLPQFTFFLGRPGGRVTICLLGYSCTTQLCAGPCSGRMAKWQ